MRQEPVIVVAARTPITTRSSHPLLSSGAHQAVLLVRELDRRGGGDGLPAGGRGVAAALVLPGAGAR